MVDIAYSEPQEHEEDPPTEFDSSDESVSENSDSVDSYLKAFNNHFGDRSKIKIPKIRPFCNLKSAKIAKKMWKNIFSVNFGRYDLRKTL